MQKKSVIIFGLLGLCFFLSCRKTKKFEGEYSCSEVYSEALDSTYLKTYMVSSVDRKSIRIGSYLLDHVEENRYQYLIGDATYEISVSVNFVGDSAYIRHSSHYYFEDPMFTYRNASCLKK